jgi:catechol O-methyltransferase
MTTFGDILLKNEGPGPTIVPMKAQKDGVGFANLFYKDTEVGFWTDELTSALHSTNDASLLKRDPANGAWTFKANAELDLLQHVENVVAMSDANNAAVGGYGQKDASDAAVDASKTVLRAIDTYCLGKQWMYHVGHEKGEMIKPFLRESISSFKSNPERTGRFIVVDCGTYCGYSAILLASTIKECSPDLEFTVLSTEINPKHIGVAMKMIKMAKLEKHITVIQTASVETALAEHVGPNDAVDFVFFDHAKDQYLSDLQSLEKRGRMKKGTHVVADNVIVSEVCPILMHAPSSSF